MHAALEHISRAIHHIGDADACLLGIPCTGPAMKANRAAIRELLAARQELAALLKQDEPINHEGGTA